jgi:hypothetical protein
VSTQPITSNTSSHVAGARSPVAHNTPSRRRLLGELEHRGDVSRHLGPNWYASIMGTGIVANAAVLLPVHAAGLRSFALGVWLLAATLLVALTLATAVHWLRYPQNAREHHRDPAMAPFYGRRRWRCSPSAPEHSLSAET